ncbi:S-adenosyl-L-methionine-dependent methyltransferases superfamily protein isoform 2 [Hibiscus syriacus]|nr:S-adenosyl-L-methionine-dependent methyltransferases superfamily protein isoform 2 [Hibiscus syriacus]
MLCFSISFTQSAIASPHLPPPGFFFPPTPTLTPFKPRSSIASRCTQIDLTTQHEETPHNAYPKQDESPPEEEEPFQVLTSVKTAYNDILIVYTAESRMLLLDSTHNVHSILQKGGEKWTGSYWDEFASLLPIVPEGPIAIYGLGGGTAAHLMLDVWPSLQVEGWEIDEICNEVGGGLQVHIGDVFSPEQHLPSGYAGIVIDLFSDGKVLSQLQESYNRSEAECRE